MQALKSRFGKKNAGAGLVLALIALCGWLALPRATGQTPALSVYLMRSGSAEANAAAEAALREAGYSVTLGVPTPLWDGTQADLDAFDVVVLLNSYNWMTAGMPASGQRSLVRYAARGGGVVTGEWLMWNVYLSGYGRGLAPMMPATTSAFVSSAQATTYSRSEADPVVDAGVSPAFTFTPNDVFGSESTLVAKPSARVFFTSSGSGGAGVIGWDYQSGRVLNFSSFISQVELSNPDYRRLFVNAVRWAAGG